MSNTKKLFSQIIKFGFVGGTAFVIDAGLLFLLTEFCGIHYLISGMISFTASVIYNYILSVKWVFDAKKDANKTQEFIVFIVLSVIGLGINQLFMWLFVDMMHIYYMLSKIIADPYPFYRNRRYQHERTCGNPFKRRIHCIRLRHKGISFNEETGF